MYEIHEMLPDFPILFHTDMISDNITVCPHWHENLEILNVIEGKGKILLDGEELIAKTGDIVIINSNTVHNVFSTNSPFIYYCLIINIDTLSQFGIELDNLKLKNHISDEKISSLFAQIDVLMKNTPPLYKPEVFANALKIVSTLTRNYILTNALETNKSNSKNNIVKNAIKYMKSNLDKDITLKEICTHLGFTKCYFCHTFKEVTGTTAIKIFNFLKCEKAKRLLTESKFNVSEVAEKCGFASLSYFSKMYKSTFGELPSETRNKSYNKKVLEK